MPAGGVAMAVDRTTNQIWEAVSTQDHVINEIAVLDSSSGETLATIPLASSDAPHAIVIDGAGLGIA